MKVIFIEGMMAGYEVMKLVQNQGWELFRCKQQDRGDIRGMLIWYREK